MFYKRLIAISYGHFAIDILNSSVAIILTSVSAEFGLTVSQIGFGAMVYTFARISAVLDMNVDDYFQVGRKMMFRLLEKGGRQHEMPAHHTLIEYMDAYRQRLDATEGALFRTVNRQRNGFTENRLNRKEACAMVKRRCKAAGLGNRFSNHTTQFHIPCGTRRGVGQAAHEFYRESFINELAHAAGNRE